MNFVPEVLTNPVSEGAALVVVGPELVVVLLVVETVVVLELGTVVAVEDGRRHWKKKGFNMVHTNPATQTGRRH